MLIFIIQDTPYEIKMKQPHKAFAVKEQKENIVSVHIAHTNQLEKHLTSGRSTAREFKQNITEGGNT